MDLQESRVHRGCFGDWMNASAALDAMAKPGGEDVATQTIYAYKKKDANTDP